MKCKFCGAKIKKSDELCPECEKYISKKSASAAYKKRSDTEPTSPLGKNIRFLECGSFGDSTLASCLMFGIIALYAVICSIPSRYQFIAPVHRNEFIVKNILLISACLAVIVIGIVIFSTCKKCFVCVNVFGVYGIKPKFLIIPERFEFFYDDITDFSCRIPASGGIPVVTVTANGRVYRIYGLSNKDASYLSTFVREIMPQKSKKRH